MRPVLSSVVLFMNISVFFCSGLSGREGFGLPLPKARLRANGICRKKGGNKKTHQGQAHLQVPAE